MIKRKKIVSVIPARGGSKGIPRKNIKLLAGKPLIAYTIEQALRSQYIDEVYVSTEDSTINKISEKFGAMVIKRPAELASDNISSDSVLLHFAKNIDFDILVFLQCTSPLTLFFDMDNAIKLLIDKKYNSVLSVCEDHGGFLCGGFLWDRNGNSINYDYRNRPRRQDIENVYRENGAIYVTTKKDLLMSKNRLNGRIGLYIMPRIRSFEIDDKEDFKLMEKIIKVLQKEQIPKKKVKNISLIIFDVDGVFTDGKVYLNKKGEEMLKFSRIDGKGIELIKGRGIRTAIITSEDSEIVRKRMEKLRIDDIYIGIKDKLEIYDKLKNIYNLKDENICFCGDDLQDLNLIKQAGFSACPKNAQEEIKRYSIYISEFFGGDGFVRDVCNIILNQKEA